MLLCFIFFPMAAGILAYCLDSRLVPRVVTAIELLLALFLAFGENQTAALSGICDLGLFLTLDGFRKIYCTVITFLWCMTSWFSKEYFQGHHHLARYDLYNLMTLGATLGVFLAGDLFTAFIFFEIMSFTSYTWVLQEETPEAIRAANTYLTVAVLGGLVALMGLFLLQFALGTTKIDLLYSLACAYPNKSLLYTAAGCILFGFGAKAGMFPLHIWLPKAHPVAPAPASALLSGLLTKSGVWGILVLSCNVLRYDPLWGKVVLYLGTVTMVLGAVLALFSVDLKRTLACSSMSQIGFVLVGIGMMGILGEENALAARGTLLHMMNHSLFKLVLFQCAGSVYMKCHALNLNEIQGYGRRKPLLKLTFLSGGLGIGGIPLFSGYVSKTLLHESIVEAGSFAAVEWLFLLSGGLTLAYMTKLYVCIFVEKHPTKQAAFDAMRPAMSPLSGFAILLPAILIPTLGCFPQRIMLPLADMGTDFFHTEALPHALQLFSLENLKGAGISLVIGAVVYFGFVRTVLKKNDAYVNRWNPRLDLEELVYRPLLLRILPGIVGWFCALFGENRILGAPVRAFVRSSGDYEGAPGGRDYLGLGGYLTGSNRFSEPIARGFFRVVQIFSHALLELPDALVLVLRKTVYRDSPEPRAPGIGSSPLYRLGDRIDRRTGREKYAKLFYRAGQTLRHTTRLITGNLSFALLMLCAALCLVLIYVIIYHT